jgi:hypothetical protein
MAFEKDTGDYGIALPLLLLFTLSFFSILVERCIISLLYSAYTAFSIRSVFLQSCFFKAVSFSRFLHFLVFSCILEMSSDAKPSRSLKEYIFPFSLLPLQQHIAFFIAQME